MGELFSSILDPAPQFAGPDYPDVDHLKLSTKRGRDEKRSAERYLFVAKQRRGHPRGVSIDPNCHMLRSIWV